LVPCGSLIGFMEREVLGARSPPAVCPTCQHQSPPVQTPEVPPAANCAQCPTDIAMFIRAGEPLRVSHRIRMRRPVRAALECDCRHTDAGRRCQLLLHRIVRCFTGREPQAPAIVVDRDGDMVRVVERARGSIEGRVIEGPFRRGELPNEPRELAPVLCMYSRRDPSAAGCSR
jgi:hypothetical protein